MPSALASFLSPTDLSVLSLLTAFSALVGIAGALISIFTFLFSSKLRSTALARLTLGIALADFFAIALEGIGRMYNFGAHGDGIFCNFQAAQIQFGEGLQVLLYVCVGWEMLRALWRGSNLDAVREHDKYVLAACAALALVASIIPLTLTGTDGQDLYGPADLWCWISPQAILVRWILFYIPLVICFLINITILVGVMLGAYRHRRENAMFKGMSVEDERLNAVPWHATFYFFAFLITWTPVAAARGYRIIHPNETFLVLDMIMAVCLPIRGMTDCVIGLHHSWHDWNLKQETVGKKEAAMGWHWKV